MDEKQIVGTKLLYGEWDKGLGKDKFTRTIGFCKELPNEVLLRLMQSYKIYRYNTSYLPNQEISSSGGLIILPVYKESLKGLAITGTLKSISRSNKYMKASRLSSFSLDELESNINNAIMVDEITKKDFSNALAIIKKESINSGNLPLYDLSSDEYLIYAYYRVNSIFLGRYETELKEVSKILPREKIPVKAISIVGPGLNTMRIDGFNRDIPTYSFDFVNQFGENIWLFDYNNKGNYCMEYQLDKVGV